MKHSVLLALLAALGCASSRVSTTVTKAEQEAMTPDQALARLMDGNSRFVNGKSLHRDYVAQRTETARGQYPFAVVLSCIDSRSIAEIVFDQGIGDLFTPSVAGNYAPLDIAGSIEFATKVAGAKLVLVLGHTECGAVKGSCDGVELGNLTAVLRAIRPAVDSVKDVPGERNSKNPKFVLAATQENVRFTVANLRAESPIVRELEGSGRLKVVGAMHDLASGSVTLVK